MLKFFAEKMWVAFAFQKLLTFFQQKNIIILYIESAKTVNEMTVYELVKLTTLWTTGLWSPRNFELEDAYKSYTYHWVNFLADDILKYFFQKTVFDILT